MDFLDKSGHIFSLQSYEEEPIGYEFDENKYIFWIDSPTTNSLSINNYYAKTINFLLYYDDVEGMSFDDLIDVEISIKSNKFWLLNPQQIQDFINGNNIEEHINISEDDDIYEVIGNEDLVIVTLDENINSNNQVFPRNKVVIIPIYILTTASEIGTWISNIMIHVSNKREDYDAIDEQFCPISVGGIYKEENEILSINGTNMGISLPKEIYKAVYECSYINDEFDEQLANEKLREYLINFMEIKGELGNYKSIQNGLEWFGYGDKITISKLLKTDNQFKTQYVKDFFTLNTDILDSFKSFTNQALLSLTIKENEEILATYDQDFGELFWGENKPYLNDIFNSVVPVEVGIGNDKWTYYKNYYDYSLYEIGLKLSCLKYYYQKYFLPIHLKIHSATITHKVFTNDIKFDNYVYRTVRTEYPILMSDDNEVEFPSNHIRYFTNQIHYINDQYNEFEGIDNEDVYKINDVCLNIPIKFKSYDKYYNCVLLLEKEKTLSEDRNHYQLKIINKPFNPLFYDINLYDNEDKSLLDTSEYLFRFKNGHTNEWSSYSIGYDNFKSYLKDYFSIVLYSKNSEYGDENNATLEIEYDDNLSNNIKISIDIQKVIEENKNIDSDILNLLKSYITNDKLYVQKTPIDIVDRNYYIYVPGIDDFNFNPLNVSDVIGNIIIIPKLEIEMKLDKEYIYDCVLKSYNNSLLSLSIKNNIKILYIESSTLLYETHFNFIQNENDDSTIYKCFVLYPKILNDHNINYYVDQKYILRLLVNNRWYEYKFESKLQDIYIDLGKIEYSYWNTSDNYYSNFSQLSDIKPNEYKNGQIYEYGYVKFNSYMFEPEFSSINSIKYISDIEEYLVNNSLDYISNDILKYVKINKHIDINEKCTIWFTNEYLYSGSEIRLLSHWLDIYDHIYVINKNIVLGRIDENTYKVFKNTNYALNKLNKEFNTHIYDLTNNTDMTVDSLIISGNPYNVKIHSRNDYENIFDIPVKSDKIFNLYSNDTIYNSYNYLLNFSDNSKFINRIYVYDLYEPVVNSEDILKLSGSFEVSSNGLTFTHSIYDNYENNVKNKVFINGRTLWTNQYYDDNEYYNKKDEWNENDRDKYRGYTLSKIVDLYGFYWGNYLNNNDDGTQKLETIYTQTKAAQRYFYYYSVELNEPIYNDKKTITKTIKICDFILDNFKQINKNSDVNINNIEYSDDVFQYINFNSDIPSKYSDINVYYSKNKQMFFIKYKNTETSYNEEEDDVIVKIQYVKNNETFEEIETSEYIKLMLGNDSEYKIKFTIYINYVRDYIGEKVFVSESEIFTDESGNMFIEIDGKQIPIYIEYAYIDERNDSMIPKMNPKNYIWSANEIFNIDSGEYDITNIEDNYDVINDYLDDTGDLQIYWHTEDDYMNSNDFNHKRSYIQKDILQYLVNDSDNFLLSWESSDQNEEVEYELSCEVMIIRENNEIEIYNANNSSFTLNKTDKSALLYFVVNTKNERNIDISDAWIIPHLFYDRKEYVPVKYDNGNIDPDQQINMKTINMLYDYNNSENVINLYNELFYVGMYDKDNKELLTEYAYEVEKVYNIEKRYDVWKLTNSFSIMEDEIPSIDYIKFQYEDIIKYYIIDSSISYHNFINLAKFDFSYKNKIDFYDVKAYDMNDEEIHESNNIEDERYIKIINQNINILESSLDYDIYLMHDLKTWHIVFISKETISKEQKHNEIIKEILPYTSTDRYENGTKYKLIYNSSKETFLINRMKYISNGGVNHFNKTDMIAAKILNMKLPVNIYSGVKWEIIPKSIGMKPINIESNAEFTILSLPMNNSEHQRGYYDINLRYCIDNNIQHQLIKTGKIRIS